MSNYSEKDIEVLSPIDGIRRRPTMYIGPTDSNGIFHILKEVADNAVDEALAKRNNIVAVAVDKDGTIWVGDNAKGIPTGIHPKTKLSTLTTIFTHTHAGGKFGSKAYKDSIGTHGVGIKATNALSEKLTVWTCYNKAWHTQSFKKGEPVKKSPDKVAKPKLPKSMAGCGGTIVCFTPDMTIFDKDSKLNEEAVYDWCEMTAYLNPKLQVKFTDSNGEVEEWCFKNGLQDYVEWKLSDGKLKQVASLNIDTATVNCYASFIESDDCDMEFYTNSSFNSQGGLHEKTFWDCLYEAIYQFAKRDHEFEVDDLKSGIVGAFNIRLEQPKFSSQTKERLVDERAKSEQLVNDLYENMRKFFVKNKELTQNLLTAATEAYANRSTKLQNKKLAKDLKAEAKSGTLLPGKLTIAPKCKPMERELFLVEGDSAGGPAKAARISTHYQEVLTLKGKPLNVARSTEDKIIANEEVFSILLALGYDPMAKDPYANLRVKGKLVLLADADPDGKHINLLLLTMLAVLLPKMFEMKIVHIAVTPEYMANYKGKNYYGVTKADLIKALPKGANVAFQHLKGWGEAPPQVLREVAFDPATRMLQLVKKPERNEVSNFIKLMSDDIEERRRLIGI